MNITLTNDFHNTSVSLRSRGSRSSQWLSARQVQRARKMLCGHADCRCSGIAGTRGQQSIRLDMLYGTRTGKLLGAKVI